MGSIGVSIDAFDYEYTQWDRLFKSGIINIDSVRNSMMKKFHERRLQEERKRMKQYEKNRWDMIEKAIIQETKRKAMRDAESMRLQQKAELAQLIRWDKERIARENQAGHTSCFRRYLWMEPRKEENNKRETQIQPLR